MKKIFVGLFFAVGMGLLLALSAGKAVAYSITFDYTTDSSGYISKYAPLVETFDGSALALTMSGDYHVCLGSGSTYAAPYGDSTRYLAVPDSKSSGSVTITLGGKGTYYTYFGLWWGSIDSYNTISFYKDGVLVASFTGSAVIYPDTASGGQSSSVTNRYVNFLDMDAFNSVVLTSNGYAFEVDNIAVGGQVPVPAAFWLLGSGLAGLVGIRRRKVK